jgi:8-amino-7-oxononanoate synthase
LQTVSARVRAALMEMGAPIAPSHGPIVPWMVGDPREALALSEALLADGIFVQAIRPPTVPPGSSRLRLSLHARLGDDDVARLLSAARRLIDSRRSPL